VAASAASAAAARIRGCRRSRRRPAAATSSFTRAEDLSATFTRVADELHRQYLIGFEPAKLDDKMHKIELKVKKPGMKVRARKEYFAAR
jgi:hypothetical protein